MEYLPFELYANPEARSLHFQLVQNMVIQPLRTPRRVFEIPNSPDLTSDFASPFHACLA